MASDPHGTGKSRGAPPWKPGQSGNPGGRPKLPEAFREKGPEALARIVELMADGDPKVAVKAATWIAERIYGKAAQSIEIEGESTNALIAALLTTRKIDG